MEAVASGLQVGALVVVRPPRGYEHSFAHLLSPLTWPIAVIPLEGRRPVLPSVVRYLAMLATTVEPAGATDPRLAGIVVVSADPALTGRISAMYRAMYGHPPPIRDMVSWDYPNPGPTIQ